MKNLFKNCGILSIIILFTASCNTRLTIEKRQHSQGYYVAHNNHKHTFAATPTKTEKTESEVSTPLIEVENTQDANQLTVDNMLASTEETNLEITQSNPNVKVAIVEEIEKTTATKSDHKLEDKSDNNTRTINSAKNKIKTILSRNSIEREAHSLLWIVIIVLLILWALGLIGGIGASGLIHLLLVIALILLILWLLRVI